MARSLDYAHENPLKSNDIQEISGSYKRKLAFGVRLLKVNDAGEHEFQFEEIRAQHYFAMYEKFCKEHQNEILGLKKKVASMEQELEKNKNNKVLETVTTSSFKDSTNKSRGFSKNNHEPQETQKNDLTQFIQPLEFNTQKIPHISLTNETAIDETFTNIQDNIQNLTVDSTKCIVEKSQFIEQQQSQFIEHHQSQYQSQLTFNQSKITIPSNMTITNNLTLPELALPPDFTGLKSFVFNDKNKEPEFELLTRERMEETMTPFFKKSYKIIAEATGGTSNMTANPCLKGNKSKLGDFEHATKTLPNIWKLNIILHLI
jgi:hypothetical protein